MLGIKIVQVCFGFFFFIYLQIEYLLEIAVSLGKNDIRIYDKVGGKWKLMHTLCEHLSRVLAIDWAPNNNQLVTASAVRMMMMLFMKKFLLLGL
jgi:WD40 repeat protein